MILAFAAIFSDVIISLQLEEMHTGSEDNHRSIQVQERVADLARDANGNASFQSSVTDKLRQFAQIQAQNSGRLADITSKESGTAQRAADAALKSANALATETEIRKTEFGIEHRPKLTVHINPSYRPLEVTGQGIGIGVSATVTNERNTEADEVGYGFEFGPADSEPEMALQQEKACATAEGDTQKRTIGIGGKFTWNNYVVENRGPSFLSNYPNASIVDMTPQRYAIAGCIVYISPFDKTTIRHTKFLYYVDEIVNGKTVRGIVQMPHKIDPKNLDFEKDEFAGNNDD
jgi:hypothetical protein